MGFFNRKKKALPAVSEDQGPPHDPNGYVWGGKSISPIHYAPHYAAVGITGSGKTLLLSMLMQSVFGNGEHPRARALVYDPKLDTYPLLRGMGVAPEAIHILHPFDARSAPWDLAKDIESVGTAKQLAAILCPKDKEAKDPYWSDSAQLLLEGVILVLCDQAPQRWTLNDLVEATATPERLRSVLEQTPETTDLVGQFTAEARTYASIYSTLRSKIGPLGTAAASWARSKEPAISLREWLGLPPLDDSGAPSGGFVPRPPSILLVGADDANDEALGPINRAVFRRVSQLLTAQPDAREGTPDTWVFLDEARLAGKLEGLSSLLLKGRSKGAHVVLGFQDIMGMREVYGPNVGNELVGQCGNVAFLRVGNPETAEWASKHIGKKEYESETLTKGTTETKDDTSETESRSITAQEKDVVPPQDFMLLQMPSLEKGEGMRGVFAIPGDRWIRTVHSPDISRIAPKPSADLGFVPAPAAHQRRLLWGPADFERLSLTELSPDGAPVTPEIDSAPPGNEAAGDFTIESLD